MFGHTLLICGSKGMGGSAVLATGGALRSGCGLVTIHLPYSERLGILSNYPSALFSIEDEDCFVSLPRDLNKYDSIAIGCGLGQSQKTVEALSSLLNEVSCPLVLDADALNIIAAREELKKLIPRGSILTPHLGELKRLIGNWSAEESKIKRVKEFAKELQSVVVVKGAHSMICLPDGSCFFNSTGNSGMAKGGSGDILSGLLAGLISRGYSADRAAILGVYLHGLGGDLAAAEYGMESMCAKDIIDFIPKAFKTFNDNV